jgi:hypothetical protein
MIAIYSAIGLFPQPVPLNPTPEQNIPDPKRTWKVSEMVPFSGRMVVERLTCRTSGITLSSSDRVSSVKEKEERGEMPMRKSQFVRILVNDKVMPLSFCNDGGEGICSLRRFVKSQAYARHDGEGDWEQCKYTW